MNTSVKKPAVIFAIAMGALGLFAGYFANKQTPGEINPEAVPLVLKPEKRSSNTPLPEEKVSPTSLPQVHSEETLETLIAQGENASYAGLALWLIDASEPDIAAYWESRKSGKLSGDIKRLIFHNWTRLDPQAAITAVAGTSDAMTPWWTWAAHDPRAALAAAGPDQMKSVANGIGQLQPEWLREHFDLIPEEVRSDALNGLMNWKEDSDHVATLDFLKEHGIGFHTNLFKTLARKDPWAAYDWLEKNDKLDSRDNGPVDVLLAAMKSGQPDDLERLAAMTPPGALQRKIEDALFESLLATDPEAALIRAKSTDAPLIAARRLAKIGTSLLASDPGKAFGIGTDIIAASPDQVAPKKQIETDRGSTSWGAEDSAAMTFMESLLVKDPERTLEMTTTGNQTVTQTFRELSGKWAERNLVEFTEWVNRQPAGPVRNAAASSVVNQLSNQGHFQEAAEWAMSGDPGSLYSLAWQWGRSNRTEANAWLESADLQDSVKGNLRNYINRNE